MLPAIALGAGALAAGYFGLRSAFPHHFADSANYEVLYEAPNDWRELPKSPMTLFLFKHPDREVFLRGSVNNIESDYAVTPEMDFSMLAEYYLSTTQNNQKEWKGERLRDVRNGKQSFSMIRRWRKDKTVFTAFAQKGNTTLLVGLYAADSEAKSLGAFEPMFRSFLATLDFKPRAH